MAKHSPDPKLLAIVKEAIEAGASQASIAEMAGVCKATVGRWAKAEGWTPRTPCPPALAAAAAGGLPPDDPPDDPPPPPEWSDDNLVNMRAMHRDLIQQARDSRKIGNYTAAQRAMRDAVNLANDIARVERSRQEGADVISIPRSEIDAIQRSNRDKIARMLERPLLCAECGRRLLQEKIEGKD